MKPASATADMESIIDDVQEALRWKPILPLLKATRWSVAGSSYRVAKD